MPARFEAIRNRFIREGMPVKEAKMRAARIFNATRKRGQRPVTRREEGSRKSKAT